MIFLFLFCLVFLGACSVCVMFLYVFVFDCKCKSSKRLGENIYKTTKKHKETLKNIKYVLHKFKNRRKKRNEKQKYRISSPRTSANKSHKIFAEVRGLDILYFCLFVVVLLVALLLCLFLLFFNVFA